MLSSIKPMLDAGTVKAGETKPISFTLKNSSGEYIMITRIVPSCGCTTVTNSRYKVGPKENVNIIVNFNSAGKSGLITKSVHVYYSFHGEEQVLVQKFAIEVK